MHALRNVYERTTRPNCRVQGRELVVAGRNHGSEMFLEDLWVLFECCVGVEEDNALRLEVFTNLVVNHLRLILRCHTGHQTAALCFRDA